MGRKYLVHVGLRYPLNPDADRAEWEIVDAGPGDVVDNLPEVSVPWLEEQGAISVAGRDRHKLAEDFPGRALLIDAGYATYADVERHLDEVGALHGVGDKTLAAIRDALIAHATGEDGDDGETR